MTSPYFSIPGLTSLLSTSTALLVGELPVPEVTRHIACALDIFRENPDYVSYRLILEGLRETAEGPSPSREELAEELYYVGHALAAASNDRNAQQSLNFSLRGLGEILRASGPGFKPAGGLFQKGVDPVEEDRARTLRALTSGVYHDVVGIVAGVESVLNTYLLDIGQAAERTGTTDDRRDLDALLSELEAEMQGMRRLLLPIRLALCLSGARPHRRELFLEPFKNGDIARLAEYLGTFPELLDEVTKAAERILSRIDLRPTDEEFAEAAANIQRAGEFLSGRRRIMANAVELVKSLLLIYEGMGERLKLPVSLHDSLDISIMRSTVGRRIELTANLEPNPGKVMGPACHLTQIIYNLLTNAAEAIHGKGKVTIRTERVALESVNGGAREEYMKLSVQDTGSGIPEEMLQNIFKPGVSGKGSSGLGLYVIREIVGGLGGSLHVLTSTRPPSGTTFSIYLPVIG